MYQYIHICYASLTLWRISLRMLKNTFAANSPDSGEYMANGLANAIRNQSQRSQNDRQIFVGVRKNSRSFVWCCEYYATLTLWRISCECKTFISAAYSPEMIRLPRRITEKVRHFKWLRMLPNFLRIPSNFLRSLRSVCRIAG